MGLQSMLIYPDFQFLFMFEITNGYPKISEQSMAITKKLQECLFMFLTKYVTMVGVLSNNFACNRTFRSSTSVEQNIRNNKKYYLNM